MPSFIAQPSYDTNASSYFTSANVTNTEAKQQISRFVSGVKDLGLWSNTVFWPLRAAQQGKSVGSSASGTVYSLGGLGTYNGTLSGTPTWGVNGIINTASSQNIDFGSSLDFGSSTFFYTANPSWGTLSSISDAQVIFASHSLSSGANIKQRDYSICGASMTGNTANKDATIELIDYSGGSFGFSGQANYSTMLVQNQFRFCSMQTNGTTYKFYRSGTLLSTVTGSRNFDTPGGGSDYTGSRKTAYYTTITGSASGQNIQVPLLCLVKTQVTDAQHTSLYSLYKTTLGLGLDLP